MSLIGRWTNTGVIGITNHGESRTIAPQKFETNRLGAVCDYTLCYAPAMPRLRVCYAASELAPYAKVGGLGDVAAALPRFLHRGGHDVRVFAPLYRRIYERASKEFVPVDFAQAVEVRLGGRQASFDLYTRAGGDSEAPLYFIHCPQFFDRPEVYGAGSDEHLRFVFLCRAVFESCQLMGWQPHVFHCNDWQTALIPLYLKTLYAWDRLFEASRTVLTIHNIGYQGVISAESLAEIGLAEHAGWLHQEDLAQGKIGLLKTGILYADVLTTVSPTYAREIQSGELGMGLEKLLRRRSESIAGILNGVDYDEWSPEKDRYIPFNYSLKDLTGKTKNRDALLQKLGLRPVDDRTPVLGVISRLTPQKGFELVFEPLSWALRHRDLRLAALGSGDPRIEDSFARLQRDFPGRVCHYRGFSDQLAHLIEAGSDIFLMPSLYEPCGLNQMYSLRYGTVPIVRKIGGLADTVQLFDNGSGQGTGFVFEHFNSAGFAWALDYALSVFDKPDAWRKVQANGMKEDFSWDRQGKLYVDLYSRISAAA